MLFNFIKALRENIKRAYLQTKLWTEVPFGYVGDVLDINNYRYRIDLHSIKPVMFNGPARPLDVPDPCKCKNCVNSTCSCRVQNIPCSEYCPVKTILVRYNYIHFNWNYH